MKRFLILLAFLTPVLVFVGCDSDVEGDEPGECGDGTDNDQDGVADCDDSGCAADADCTGGDDDDDDDDSDCDDIEPGPGSLEGTVVRSVAATEDGIGKLLISVFDSDPFQSVSVCEVARSVVLQVNLSGEGNGFPYTVSGLPIRTEAYHVRAVFDDNGDLDESGEAAEGDLLAFLGETMAFPTAVVPDADPVLLDLEFNFVVGGTGDDDDDSSADDDDDSSADDDDSSGD